MIEPSNVAALLEQSDFAADGEAVKSRDLILMLLEHSPAPFSRAQFTPGHITSSGLVLARDGESVLLVHHRRLDRWLLPGGHVEPEDAAIEEAARREVVEETGVALAYPRPSASAADVAQAPVMPCRRHRPMTFWVINLLNGFSFAMVLFLLAAG